MPPLVRADPYEREEHLASIEAVPITILPLGPARSVLERLAREGRDCYCYASGGETYGIWCAWLGDLARVRPDKNGRIPLAEEWVPQWRELLAEIGITDAGDETADEEASR